MGESRVRTGIPYRARDSAGASKKLLWESRNVRSVQWIEMGGATAGGTYHLIMGRDRHEVVSSVIEVCCKDFAIIVED